MGLAVGRDYVALARIEAGRRVKELREAPLQTRLFDGPPTPAAAAALHAALEGFSGALARRYVPLHVSLPDPLVRWSLFELDALPAGRQARQELVAFRFSREGLNGGHRYACQPLGEEAGKQLVLGMAADAAWHSLVASALEKAGLVAWSIHANACRQFNAFHDPIAAQSGALVALAPDAWSLSLWDAAGRLRYARGRWRAPQDEPEIAAETERAILAYVHGRVGRDVSRVFVIGEGQDGVASALDARLREPCARLSFHEALAGAPPAPAAPLVFAAALER